MGHILVSKALFPVECFVVMPNPFPPSPAWRISFGFCHESPVESPLCPMCNDSAQPVAEKAGGLPLETREQFTMCCGLEGAVSEAWKTGLSFILL